MTDRARLLLDELLGPHRNNVDGSTASLDFNDPLVCKYNLVAFCPYKEFKNTKYDIGTCKYIHHEEYLKASYNKTTIKNTEYEIEMMNLLENILIDFECRKIKAKERTSSKSNVDLDIDFNANNNDLEENIFILESQLIQTLKQMENLGIEGKIAESYDLILQVERIKADLEKLREQNNPCFGNDQKMNVCDVCGSFVVLNDTQRKLDKHFEGKLHKTCLLVRNKLAELLLKYKINKNVDFLISKDRLYFLEARLKKKL